MKFGDFQYFVGRHGLWLPLDPVGGSCASVGGILAANSAGPLRVRHGSARDMVLGMKIATPEGKVIKTGGRVVKNVAGYDLVKLFIGSYGTLGVIVEASFKLYPLPAERATFVLPTGTLGIARDLRRKILHSPLQPMRLALLDPQASTLVRQGSPLALEIKEPEMWIEAGGSARVIERYKRELEDLGRAAGAPVQELNVTATEDLWSRVSDFPTWLKAAYPRLVILKAALPIAASEEFLSHAQQEAEGENARLASFAQVGIGVVHLCFLEFRTESGIPPLIGRLREAAQSLGGALVVEHCPADLKPNLDVWGPCGDNLGIMRKLKEMCDPKGILAPGRSVGSL